MCVGVGVCRVADEDFALAPGAPASRRLYVARHTVHASVHVHRGRVEAHVVLVVHAAAYKGAAALKTDPERLLPTERTLHTDTNRTTTS